jgi:6-phosphofructo-2-kinase/fructose-2,6-biphosphatase 1
VARKLVSFLEWYGCECKIFNVGKYRRKAYASLTASTSSKDLKGEAAGACDADFFDANNTQAAALREQVAEIALRDMLKWIDNEQDDDSDGDEKSVHSYNTVNVEHHDRIAIFDATNSTDKRRRWVLEECTDPAKRPGKPTGVVFVESICDDQELLDENFRFKISNSPDYAGMNEQEAMEDLRNRVRKYEDQYETITDDSLSYIKIFNLSTKLLVNHIYGRMSKVIVPALMAWNIGSRPIFLCRPGQTLSDLTTDRDDFVTAVNVKNDEQFKDMSAHSRKRLLRGDNLGPGGKKFSDALYDFVFEECTDFALKRASIFDNATTGTSISGLASFTENGNSNEAPFTVKIYSSTMPRASETVRWDEFDFPVTELSTLNPLDKGDFVGKELDEIRTTNPSWYSRLEKNPFTTRFPGGESYKDLIRRLESVVVDLEQQVIPTLVVSHVSVLQMLIAYFRRSPVEEAMQIEVPLHSVIKFSPVRGGGWKESQHQLAPVYEGPSTAPSTPNKPLVHVEGMERVSSGIDNPTSPTPIWGDHMRKPSSASLSQGERRSLNFDEGPEIPHLRK